ncbi:MAG: hypothetical protein QM664_02470 [Flavihumibacter sp.]
MARPVQFNVKNEGGKKIDISQFPGGYQGEGFLPESLPNWWDGAEQLHVAPAVRYFVLRYRIYGHHGFTL